jgi:hypothetical protein
MVKEDKKAKRKLKRKVAKAKAIERGAKVKEAALRGGYVPHVPPKKFVGSGDYSNGRTSLPMPKQHVLRGRGDLIDDGVKFGAGIVENGLRKGWGAIKNFFGFGDYSNNSVRPHFNSFFGGGIPAVFGSSGTPGTLKTRVAHKEMLGTVTSNATFQLQRSIVFNPGLSSTFPWCSTVASAFQRWKPLGAMLVYEPNIDAYGGANINGKVTLATRYLISEPAPINMTEMENCQYSVSGRPGQGLVMAIECAPSMGVVNNLNVRTGSYTAGESLTFFDHCTMDVAVQGQADSTATLGSLYLIYDVEFEMPIDISQAGSLVLSDKFQCSGVATGSPLGTTRTAVASSSLGGATTATTYTFPSYVTSGEWLIVLSQVAATSVSGTPTITATSGCTRLTVWSNSTGFDLVSAPGAAQTAATVTCVLLTVTAASAVVTFGSTTISGTTNADLVVTPVDADIITLSRERRMFSRQIREDANKVARNDEMMSNMIEAAVREAILRMAGPQRSIVESHLTELRSSEEKVADLRRPPCLTQEMKDDVQKIIEVGDKMLETKAKNEEKLREENRQASLRRIGYRMRYAPLNSYVENLIDQMEISPDYETIEVLEKWKSDIEEYHEQVVAGLETMKKEFQDHLINISDYASLYTQLNSLRGKLAAFVRMLVLVINRKNKPSDDTPRSYEDLGGESA